MKIIIKDRKKMIRSVSIIITGILLIVGIILLIVNLTSSSTSENGLKKKLEKEGKKFYEEFYFNNEYLKPLSEEDIKNFLKEYEEIGLKITLYTLSTYNKSDNSFLNQFINSKTKKPCDANETKVIIYPKKPYDNKSYRIETELSCD